jgi:Transcriptional regulators
MREKDTINPLGEANGDAPETVERLRALLPNLATKQRKAAEYLLAHPDQVAFLSLRKVASAACVSPGVVLGLLRELGFRSYEDFKADFQQWVTGRYNYFSVSAKSTVEGQFGQESILEKVAANDIENIRRTVTGETVEKLRTAAARILRARKVYVLGMRATAGVAIMLAYQFTFIRADVAFLDNYAGTIVDVVADLTDEDVVIAISFFPYGSANAATVRIAADRGAHVIALTDREDSPISMRNGITLIFSVESPWVYNSITAGFTLAQALVAETLALMGDAALHRIKERDKLLHSLATFERL